MVNNSKINLKKDIIFKTFFSRKGNEEFLIDFLNALLKVDMNDKLNQWLAFIDDYDKEMVEMAEVKNKTLQRARKEMTYLTGDAAVQRLEELREKWEMDRVSSINFAKRQIAEKLKKQKMSIEEISKITDLTKEQIEKL